MKYSLKTNDIYCGDCKNILAQLPSDAYEEVSRVKFENEIQIELKTVKEILEEE